MSVHHRRLKQILFSIDGEDESPPISPVQFQCQISNWQVVNNTEDGEKQHTFCGPDDNDGEFREDTDPDYRLQLTFFSDWRVNGISDFLTQHDGKTLDFVLDHHPNLPDEHVRWSGSVKIKSPNAGGDARATESQTVDYPVIGRPLYERVDESSS